MTDAAAPLQRIQVKLRYLCEGGTPQAHQFRYGLLLFDLFVLLFIVATSFTPRNEVVETLDVLFMLVHKKHTCDSKCG